MNLSENIHLKGSFHHGDFTAFCEIDDFCKVFERVYQRRALSNGRRRKRKTRLSRSEVMTILVLYHASGYKNLKAFYLERIALHHRADFSRLCSYERFVQLQSRCVMALFFYLAAKHGTDTGLSFIDATVLKVCHNLRIPAHKVFQDSAARDKSSTGWY
jgi:hypothetical protein